MSNASFIRSKAPVVRPFVRPEARYSSNSPDALVHLLDLLLELLLGLLHALLKRVSLLSTVTYLSVLLLPNLIQRLGAALTAVCDVRELIRQLGDPL